MQELADPDKRVVGTKQVLRHVQDGAVDKVYVANDADESIRLKIMRACEECEVDVLENATMHELGIACKIQVGAATAGVLKKLKP